MFKQQYHDNDSPSYHAEINTCQTRGRVLSRWLNCIGLLIANMIVPVIVLQIFNSIAELGTANLIGVSNWQAVTQNLEVGLLSGNIWLFLKIRGWDYNRAWDYTRLSTVKLPAGKLKFVALGFSTLFYSTLLIHARRSTCTMQICSILQDVLPIIIPIFVCNKQIVCYEVTWSVAFKLIQILSK